MKISSPKFSAIGGADYYSVAHGVARASALLCEDKPAPSLFLAKPTLQASCLLKAAKPGVTSCCCEFPPVLSREAARAESSVKPRLPCNDCCISAPVSVIEFGRRQKYLPSSNARNTSAGVASESLSNAHVAAARSRSTASVVARIASNRQARSLLKIVSHATLYDGVKF
eukprot:6184261-Pleurochrysis_carterae.AAC.4